MQTEQKQLRMLLISWHTSWYITGNRDNDFTLLHILVGWSFSSETWSLELQNHTPIQNIRLTDVSQPFMEICWLSDNNPSDKGCICSISRKHISIRTPPTSGVWGHVFVFFSMQFFI